MVIGSSRGEAVPMPMPICADGGSLGATTMKPETAFYALSRSARHLALDLSVDDVG